MIGTRKRTNEILNKYNLRAKKGYGQNFLIDENILRKIVESAQLSQYDGVVEIGPGIGALTEILLINSQKVLAYEIDQSMIKVLSSELIQFSNLKLINEDFLKADISSDLSYLDDCKRILVISNLPYYITTPIIFKLLSEKNRICEYFFMVQKEVAMRLTSKPNTKDYNALSVLMEYKTSSSIVFDVSRNCFMPSPNVDSTIIHIVKKQIDLSINNEPKFLQFIQNIFAQRRKTLINNIASAYSLNKDEITNILYSLGFNPQIRSEALSLTEIANIYKTIFESPI